jgi:uncharacterized protein (DUF1330 family)
MMTAYVIGHVKVLDDNLWNQYRQSVPDTFKEFGAEVIIRANKIRCLSGQDISADQIVVISFPNTEHIESWYQSSSYQKLISLRDFAADVQLFSYSGT